MKKLLKKLVPKKIFSTYHFLKVKFFQYITGDPTQKMLVIGVTGTKGKSTAANMIWSVLMAAGYKTGLTGTANFKIGNEESLNPYHMTMPGPEVLFPALKKMKDAGCSAVVVETTSEGVKQHRNRGINYDLVVFTNLSPEHIDSHGSYHNYRAAKGELFRRLLLQKKKVLKGKKVDKKMVIFGDDPEAEYFLQFGADEKITFGFGANNLVRAEQVRSDTLGFSFTVDGTGFHVPLLGVFNAENALAAVAVGRALGISAEQIATGLKSLPILPGRMEKMESALPFTIIVDYAHEKKSMTALLTWANQVKGAGHVIILLGAEGGGRDKGKRPVMGELAARMADYLIVSNVDPYDDDPVEIIEDIVVAAERAGMKKGERVFAIEDRREGIDKALSLARAGDIVLITGKGAEQFMVLGGKRITWDDRTVVREEMQKMLNK